MPMQIKAVKFGATKNSIFHKSLLEWARSLATYVVGKETQ